MKHLNHKLIKYSYSFWIPPIINYFFFSLHVYTIKLTAYIKLIFCTGGVQSNFESMKKAHCYCNGLVISIFSSLTALISRIQQLELLLRSQNKLHLLHSCCNLLVQEHDICEFVHFQQSYSNYQYKFFLFVIHLNC